MSGALLSLLVGLAAAAAPPDAGAPAARVAKRPVVLVLYFDNETNNRDFDVLQKGLADMMVTDLIASGAADVVEREKLQALVDELNLQRGKYFDPGTAQRLGKLVGATHAVVGAIQEAKERLRLSVRVIEQETGRVLVAQEVFGPKGELFELQQRLVTLMLGALDVKLGRKATVRSAGNVDSLLSYSKAVDLADHGELTLAATRMAEVLLRSPGSELARDKKDSLAAGERRRAAGDEVRRQLRAKAESVLAGAGPLVKMPELKAARQLTYRVIRGQCLALGVKARLTPKPMHNIPEGREAEVRALLEAYRDNLLALGRELAEWRGPWRWLPDPGDGPLLEQLELSAPFELLLQGHAAVARRWEGQLVLLGYLEPCERQVFLMRPTLGELSSATMEAGLKAMDEAAALFAKLPAADLPDEQVLRTLDNKALGQFVLGQKEPAVKTWQDLLERFPKSKQYPMVEDHLQEALELNSKGRYDGEEDRALAAAVAACDPALVQRSLDPVASRKYREEGLWGLRPVLQEVERACGARPAFAPAMGLVYYLGADFAERHGDCAMFERMAVSYGRARPEKLDKLRADHPGCLRQEGK
ncbi:MAG: CsgG/HfaB family protein [Myxococcaceae bacterium]